MVHFQRRYSLAVDLILLIFAISVVVIAAVNLDPSTTILDILSVGATISGIFILAAGIKLSTYKKRLITIGVLAIIVGVALGATHTAPKKQTTLLVYTITESGCTMLIQPDDGVIHTTGEGDWHILSFTTHNQSDFDAKLTELISTNQLGDCTQVTLP